VSLQELAGHHGSPGLDRVEDRPMFGVGLRLPSQGLPRGEQVSALARCRSAIVASSRGMPQGFVIA
jgi:hypothetical protein